MGQKFFEYRISKFRRVKNFSNIENRNFGAKNHRISTSNRIKSNIDPIPDGSYGKGLGGSLGDRLSSHVILTPNPNHPEGLFISEKSAQQ